MEALKKEEKRLMTKIHELEKQLQPLQKDLFNVQEQQRRLIYHETHTFCKKCRVRQEHQFFPGVVVKGVSIDVNQARKMAESATMCLVCESKGQPCMKCGTPCDCVWLGYHCSNLCRACFEY